MMKKALCSAFVAAALLVGCGDSGIGNKFIGKWVNVKADNDVLSIESNGDSLIIRRTDHVMAYNNETKNVPATLKDGMLQPAGALESAYVIDKATGNLTNGFAEYKRAK